MARSNPLRVVMLIAPPRPWAGMSGVGTFVISIVEMLLVGTASRLTARVLPTNAPESTMPSIVMPEVSEGMPRTEASVPARPE